MQSVVRLFGFACLALRPLPLSNLACASEMALLGHFASPLPGARLGLPLNCAFAATCLAFYFGPGIRVEERLNLSIARAAAVLFCMHVSVLHYRPFPRICVLASRPCAVSCIQDSHCPEKPSSVRMSMAVLRCSLFCVILCFFVIHVLPTPRLHHGLTGEILGAKRDGVVG